MANERIPGTFCQIARPIAGDSGTNLIGLTPSPNPGGYGDPAPQVNSGPQTPTAWDRIAGIDDYTVEHTEKVVRIINWALMQAAGEYKYMEMATKQTRFNVLYHALMFVVNHREADKHLSETNLAYRDADHYLSARVMEFALRVKKEADGSKFTGADGYFQVGDDQPVPLPISALYSPLVHQGYEAVKKLEEIKQQIVPGENMAKYGKHNPSPSGNRIWMSLGYQHYLDRDVGRTDDPEPPPLLVESEVIYEINVIIGNGGGTQVFDSIVGGLINRWTKAH